MFRVGVFTFWQDFTYMQLSTHFRKALSFLSRINTHNLSIEIIVSVVIFRDPWTWITTGTVCSFMVGEGDDSLLCFALCQVL